MKNKIVLAVTFIFLTLADQIVKHTIVSTNPVIDLGLFTIQQARNTGASFGIFKDNNTILALISLIIFSIIVYKFRKMPQEYQFPLSILSAGILGNLIDRIFRGFVVDMIDFGWFPVFNIADSCIFIGIVWICTLIIKEDIADKKTGNTNSDKSSKIRSKTKFSK